MTEDAHRALAVQARQAGAVMALAMVLWFVLQWVGGRMGWDSRYAFLIDFAAIGALVWGMIVTWRVWRKRRALEG